MSEQPTLPSSERDRRWSAVRAQMAEADVDVVLVPGRARADITYLVGVADSTDLPNWLLFSRNGEPIAIGGRSARGGLSTGWVADVRESATPPAQVVGELREMAGVTPRVGVVGLEATATDGATAGSIANLRKALPGAELADLASALQVLRSRKSPAEVALLRDAASALDAAFEQMESAAEPGTPALAVLAVGVAAMCRRGSEPPAFARWFAAARPRALARPAPGLLVSGFTIGCELEARVAGYGVRARHAFGIGDVGPVVPELYRIIGEQWEQALERIQPGASLTELQPWLQERSRQLVTPRGLIRAASVDIELHGAGLGNDLPMVEAAASASVRPTRKSSHPEHPPENPVEVGWVCSLAVTLRANVEGRQYVTSWADPIAVEAGGAVRLGRRRPGSFRSV